MAKVQHFRIIENVYRQHVDVFVCPHPAVARKAIAEAWKEPEAEFPEFHPRTAAKTLICNQSGRIAIWLRRRTDIARLAHELTHVVIHIMSFCSISIVPEHDEPTAYLMEFFMNAALHELRLGRLASSAKE